MGHVARPPTTERAERVRGFHSITSSAVANESYIAFFVWSSASWMRARHLSNSDC